MKDLTIGTRVSVTEKKGKNVTTWMGTIMSVFNNLTPPNKPEYKKDYAGYGIEPEEDQFKTIKVRHHSFVKKALSQQKLSPKKRR
ncbi:MAG: hypothetical protein NTW98_00800 [Candidatus Nomurabacteria bacterium]|nr:hypothetical protein [Candidatus Nomurabacteria bacterium]